MKRNSPWFLEEVRVAREQIAAQKEARKQKTRVRSQLSREARAMLREVRDNVVEDL